MIRFRKIIGGIEEDAYQKFPWLKKAELENAMIDISKDWLVWEDGVWKGGTWKGGTWKGGIWKCGIWKDGVWEDILDAFIVEWELPRKQK